VNSVFASVVGGVGMFLLGMVLMTDGLKALAGDALRRLLERFTGSRLSAVATGAAITAIAQSSSATTLATIGFVSAGLLSFNNSIGVIIGANLGTTTVGWIISLFGLKFSIGAFAMPFIGLGALLRLLGRDRVAQAGSVIAGFGLLFVGIDVLQTGIAGFSDRIDLGRFGAADLLPRLLLVLVGLVLTVIVQSSAAAVATILAALAGGAIDTEQAAALVIGANIGTTATAVVAAIGASVPARRTALVHVMFNLVTGVIAFFILPWFVELAEYITGDTGSGADHALTIAAFHTGFSVLGAFVFVPLVPQLASLCVRMIPERRPALTRHLDPSLREVPALAIGAAVTTLRGVLGEAAAATGQGLTTSVRVPAATYAQWREAAEAAGELIERLPPGDPRTLRNLTDTLHLLDHVRQFVRSASKPGRYEPLDLVPMLRERADQLGHALLGVAPLLAGDAAVSPDLIPATPLDTGSALRAAILAASADGLIEVDEALAALNAQRWLERMNHHARRALHYLDALAPQPAADAQSAAPLDDRGGTAQPA